MRRRDRDGMGRRRPTTVWCVAGCRQGKCRCQSTAGRDRRSSLVSRPRFPSRGPEKARVQSLPSVPADPGSLECKGCLATDLGYRSPFRHPGISGGFVARPYVARRSLDSTQNNDPVAPWQARHAAGQVCKFGCIVEEYMTKGKALAAVTRPADSPEYRDLSRRLRKGAVGPASGAGRVP